MNKSLKAIIAKINKKYGKKTLGFASDLKYLSVPRLSSGSLFVDWALGTNEKDKQSGWPLGRIVELYGPESTGKSLISLKTIVEAQKKGFLCAYIDIENSFDNIFAEKLGVNTKELIISRESQAEKVVDFACELLKQTPQLKVLVFDSLASMIPMTELDNSLEAYQMASVARVMSKGLRKLTLFNNNNALIIFINQLRENPGVKYGSPIYTPGGRALKFYSSIRLEIRRGDYIFDEKKKKLKIGQVVKFKVSKNKTDIPLRDGYFKFLYDGKIDTIDEMVSLGLLREKISRRGAYYSIAEKTFQGRNDLEKELRENKEFFEKARKEIFK